MSEKIIRDFVKTDFIKYCFLTAEGNQIKYSKIHDAYTELKNGQKLIPKDASLGAIYIIRNPLDVAVSFANHCSIDFEMSVKRLCENDFTFFCQKDNVMSMQLRQKLLSWSGHVESWTAQTDIKIHVMRYEDMKNKPYETFKAAVEFIGLNDKLDRLQKAIDFSDFKILKKQEEKSGFNERPAKAKSFFREGKIASWKKHLTNEQIQKIIDTHKEVMIKFGYLSEDGEIMG